MDDAFAKEHLLKRLRGTREALIWKLDGLSEYDIRRPLTPTGTNLLGLVKHMAIWDGWYYGACFNRPFPEPLPRWQDDDGSDLWATPAESRQRIVDLCRRVWAHADTTIDALPLDAPGRVPWWSQPDTTLFAVVVHTLDETARHAGHADILREQLDGQTGVTASQQEPVDVAAREAHWHEVENAARAVTSP